MKTLHEASPVRQSSDASALDVSVVMPCLNEVETIETCIIKAQKALTACNVTFEVLIADNGSTDGSQLVAESCGARVVPVRRKGYGAALQGGIEAAAGRYIVMADADDSYDFADIPGFLAQLQNGAELVMGNRFMGGIKPGAMPFLHRYLGNPVLSFVGRLFFGSPCSDFHCGMRAFSKEAIKKLELRTLGMEFASEMVVKASLMSLEIAEVPTTLSPDGRTRAPHLRTWHDGWRHLRFLLLYSPRWLFLYPGLALMFLGWAATVWLLPGARSIGHVALDVHTMLYALMLMMLGFQASAFGVFSKVYAIKAGLLPVDRKITKFLSSFSLETGLCIGGLLAACGLGLSLYAVSIWKAAHFGQLHVQSMLRLVAPAVTMFTLGFQVIFASFFLSVLGMDQR
jgi:glycosyltransferase involved in cell wall biosynthesis